MNRYKDLTGQKFGRLTALYKLHNNHTKAAYWLCLCDCGNLTEVKGDMLRTNNTRSCGCLNIESHTKHGKANSRLYYTWCHMKTRCYNKRNRDYQNYGARGIKVCDEWLDSFQTFYDWALENNYQEGLTIDRIDNDKDYSPDNCRWSTMEQQNRNKRNNKIYVINDEAHCLKDWCKLLNLNYNTARTRLYNLKWPIKKVLGLEAAND